MAFPTTSLLDDFNRANGALAGGNWTKDVYETGGAAEIETNRVKQAGGSTARASYYWNAATFGPDSEAFFTVPVLGASGDWSACYLRIQQPGAGTGDAYFVGTTGGGSWSIFRVDNGAFTQLGASVAGGIAAGNKVGAEAIGSTIKGYRHNGTSWSEILSRTDSTYATAGNIGFRIDSGTVRIDDFSGGTVSAGGTPFTQSLAGSVAPSGAAVRLADKRLAGTISPSAVVSRLASALYGGGIAPAGAATRMPDKRTAGALAPFGAAARQTGRPAAGGIAPSGAAGGSVSHFLAGAVAPAGAAARAVARFFSGLIAPSGSQSGQIVQQTITTAHFDAPSPSSARFDSPSPGAGHFDPPSPGQENV